MTKVRAYELSKEIDVPSKEIVEVLKKYGVTTKNHMSTLEENELDIIFEHYTQKYQVPNFDFYTKEETAEVEEPKDEPVAETTKEEPFKEEEIKARVRVVDTRVNTVDLDRLDEEKIEQLMPEAVLESAKKKQKIKKTPQRTKYDKNNEELQRIARENAAKKKETFNILIPDEISVSELADRMKKPVVNVIKSLMEVGVMASAAQTIDFDTASLIAEDFGGIVEREIILTEEDKLFNDVDDDPASLKQRDPVVVVMGHVDHGKTSLLDAIRNANVTASEFGGITQHIGAHRVRLNDKEITFLDTPGHEAFTAMRARGALVTDIAILVVAADDGIMPQTVEAINHAKAANVSIIVAINKIDKEAANPDRVKQELTEHELVPEEWGGDIICVEVSALKHMGIDTLLENVLLVAEMKELKANPDRLAKGTVIESQLDKGRGTVATMLVQNGTLKIGDIVVAGMTVGRVRAMTDDKGNTITEAGPSVPVQILGLSEVPEGGDTFYVVEDERKARDVVEARKFKAKQEIQKAAQKVSLENLFQHIEEGKIKTLNIIVKADVQGSVEAVRQSLSKLMNEEVKVSVIHGGVGAVTESDIMLAAASNAIIVGFNVRPTVGAISLSQDQEVDVRLYRVIYDAIEDVENALKGMLAPKFKETVLGHIEIRATFKVSGIGTIGGAYVTDGKVMRNSQVRVVRDGIVIHEGLLASLKRFKDDVKEVAAGYECGVSIERFNDIKEKDVIEAFIMEEVKPA